MLAPVLMVLGTASSVGKSLITCGLCRILSTSGLQAAPFKAQNMSNNAAVIPNGGEIGRAQALQATAASLVASADMNPILLKPESDNTSQVIILGKPYKSLSAKEYWQEYNYFSSLALAALDRLRCKYDIVIAEGAGSPVEINIRQFDFVNMSLARYSHASVLLVADIEKGGVFAQIEGTLRLLPPEERILIKGIIINKYRGDSENMLEIIKPGIDVIESRWDIPILGVLPLLHLPGLDEEDAMSLGNCNQESPKSEHQEKNRLVDIAVVKYPHIANFTDMDAIKLDARCKVRFVSELASLGVPDVLVLPGTKSTLQDLAWLRQNGFDHAVYYLYKLKKIIIGICGGFQIMGVSLTDTATQKKVAGLGILPHHTTFGNKKICATRKGWVIGDAPFFASIKSLAIEGYEIHTGVSTVMGKGIFMLQEQEKQKAREDGASSQDGLVWGSYLHGLFDDLPFRSSWLDFVCSHIGIQSDSTGISHTLSSAHSVIREQSLNTLARAMQDHLDLSLLTKYNKRKESISE